MKKYYKDFYGGTASITFAKNGCQLKVCDAHGRLFFKSNYRTERGAKIAMGKLGDCWREV